MPSIDTYMPTFLAAGMGLRRLRGSHLPPRFENNKDDSPSPIPSRKSPKGPAPGHDGGPGGAGDGEAALAAGKSPACHARVAPAARDAGGTGKAGQGQGSEAGEDGASDRDGAFRSQRHPGPVMPAVFPCQDEGVERQRLE